ncbi:hypothetical protein [Sorangium sp. So ce1151]|uniref:hypothetical protein n=1 Tax=Sorangium sp. So ce1151 TaxID=3133332 RepID=UPI003F5D7DB9
MSTSALALPSVALLSDPASLSFPLDRTEQRYLTSARKLLTIESYDHALLDLWNAAVHNMRRRVEMYSAELFESVVKEESGRKKYKADGETIVERWEGVDEIVLLAGALRLGLISKKTHKTLETINWMRNHSSAAHGSDDSVGLEDVASFAVLLEKNLFSQSLPDPGHSVASLFEPVKTPIDARQLEMLRDQIKAYRPQELRNCFGFLLDMYLSGQEPASSNAHNLLPTAWERCSDELRKIAGTRFHALTMTPSSDSSTDKGARTRLLSLLIEVGGIPFVPDASRAVVYRRVAKKLAAAKDTSYGWNDELVAARTLAQLGPHVPSIAFEEVYQEIAATWCGNYWGHCKAHATLEPFVDQLSTDRILQFAGMFMTNARVKEELSAAKPKSQAKALLNRLKGKLVIASSQAEVDRAIAHVDAL